MASFLVTCIKIVFFLVVSCTLLRYWSLRKSYWFEHETIIAAAKKNVVFPPEKAYANILRSLRKDYDHLILDDNNLEWILLKSGGWIGSVCVISASLTEFVAFFGTAVDTSGHSGRYLVNISDTILTGSYTQWSEGSLHAVTYGQGDTVHQTWGEANGLSWSGGTWMVQYGRGVVPSCLVYTLSDTVTSTHDYYALWRVIVVFIKCLAKTLVSDIMWYYHFLVSY